MGKVGSGAVRAAHLVRRPTCDIVVLQSYLHYIHDCKRTTDCSVLVYKNTPWNPGFSVECIVVPFAGRWRSRCCHRSKQASVLLSLVQRIGYGISFGMHSRFPLSVQSSHRWNVTQHDKPRSLSLFQSFLTLRQFVVSVYSTTHNASLDPSPSSLYP